MKKFFFSIIVLSMIFSQSALAQRMDDPSFYGDEDFGIMQIPPHSKGVSFEQVNFVFEAGRVVDSDWGRVVIDMDRMRPNCSGYINVFLMDRSSVRDPLIWVIDNMYVHTSSEGRGTCDSRDYGMKAPPTTRFFDLRPGETGAGKVEYMEAVVLFSGNPLPNVLELRDMAEEFDPMRFKVQSALYNAEGDYGEVDRDSTPPPAFPPESLTYHLVGIPPQPLTPVSDPPLDLAFPIEVIQTTWPNMEAAKNQCVPMAHANNYRYLKARYNQLPLSWNLPHYVFPGIGHVYSAGDVLYWVAEPDFSIIANVDQMTKRLGVHDFETGNGSTRCQNLRGAFGYIQNYAGLAAAVFRHQGGEPLYGFGSGLCDDYNPVDIGTYSSTRDGVVPDWQWIFDQLQAGRGVVMSYGRYDSNGDRTGGHMLRVYGARKFNGKNYLLVLDDGNQGDNNVGTQLSMFEVADTENSGEDGEGKTDGMLNIDGQSWEIEFALSVEAKPSLAIP